MMIVMLMNLRGSNETTWDVYQVYQEAHTNESPQVPLRIDWTVRCTSSESGMAATKRRSDEARGKM